MANPFNLFDFTKLGWVSSIVKPPVQVPWATGGGLMPPTTTGRPLPPTPVQTAPKPSIMTGGNDIIKSFYDNPKIPFDDKKLISDAISKWMDRKEAENYLTTQYSKKNLLTTTQEEQWFLGWVAEKTKWAFMGGIERIQKAGEGLATGEYNPAEAFVRGGAGALQSAFSPISWVIGETLQSWIENIGEIIPQEFKEYVATKTKPTIENVKNWFNSQSPEQRRHLENIGVWVELLANFVWAGAVQKGTPIIKQWAVKWLEKTGDVLVKTGKQITKTPWMIKKWVGAIDVGIEEGVEKLAGKALGSSDWTAELFKATSPSYNVLAKSKDISKIKNQARLADDAVIDAGFIPKTTTERVDAYKSTMKRVWGNIEKARWSTIEKYKSKSISDTIMWEVERMKVNGKVPPSLETDVTQLLKEAEFYRNLWDVSLPDLWVIRSNINAKLTFGDKSQFSDAYGSVMKKVISKIKEWEDVVLARTSGKTTSDLLAKYGALRSMLDDVIKQDIKASRAKWLPIEESFGRISGLAEVAGWVWQLVINPKQAIPTLLSGWSKVLLGKVAGKLKDTDYLIKTGYEKLLQSKQLKNGTLRGNITAPGSNLNRATSIWGITKKTWEVKPLIRKPKPIIKPTKVNPLDLSKNKKWMINPSEIWKSVGLGRKVPEKFKELAEEVKKYDNFDDFNYAMSKNRGFMRPEPSDTVKLQAEQIKRMTRDSERLTPKDFNNSNTITVYRTGNWEIKLWDYVYSTKEEAQHALNAWQGSKIYSKIIKPSDLIMAGSPSWEYFYSPTNLWFNSLKDFYNKLTSK